MNEKLMKQLAGVSVADLETLLNQKRQEAYQPLITEYETVETEMQTKLDGIAARIREVNPEWKPSTNADRIVSFVTEHGPKVDEQKIVDGFKSRLGNPWLVKNTLKKLVEGNRLTVKEQKYTVVTA